jgi:serine/threonine protein kinase
LHLATGLCNALEALHGRPGQASGTESVLHLGLRPAAVHITRSSPQHPGQHRIVLGSYGLSRSPTSDPLAGVSGRPARIDSLAPEQTRPDGELGPATDIFSLGTLLYELLTLQPLFRGTTDQETIGRVRRSEITSELLRVKASLPGMDKILFRALSVDPRHRYRRAFVLREDLRGLMAGFSFTQIESQLTGFLDSLSQEATAPFIDSASAQEATARIDDFFDPTGTVPILEETFGEETSETHDPFSTGDLSLSEPDAPQPVVRVPANVDPHATLGFLATEMLSFLEILMGFAQLFGMKMMKL